MSLLEEMKSKKQATLALSMTRKINEDDLRLPKWTFLSSYYEAENDLSNDDKIAISVINSLMFQERMAFILIRDNVRKIIKSDKNWKEQPTFENKGWKRILRHLYDLKIIQVHKTLRRQGRDVKVFTVARPDIIALLRVNVSQQIAEVEKYITTEEKVPDTETDEVSDVVNQYSVMSNEEVVVSKSIFKNNTTITSASPEANALNEEISQLKNTSNNTPPGVKNVPFSQKALVLELLTSLTSKKMDDFNTRRYSDLKSYFESKGFLSDKQIGNLKTIIASSDYEPRKTLTEKLSAANLPDNISGEGVSVKLFKSRTDLHQKGYVAVFNGELGFCSKKGFYKSTYHDDMYGSLVPDLKSKRRWVAADEIPKKMPPEEIVMFFEKKK